MTASLASDPVSILNHTDADDALLVAWCGDLSTPFGFWPTDDCDAFESAIREWIHRDASVFGYADDESSDDDRVARHMAAIVIEEVEREDDEDSEQDIALAVSHIDARAYASETLYAYTDDSMRGTVYLVSAEDMADLGGRLRRGEPDAYSEWCSDTTAQDVQAYDVAMNARAAASGAAVDLVALRSAAASAGDIATVAAIDLCEREILDAIADLIECEQDSDDA